MNYQDYITIVITVHERQRFVKRLLMYYEDFNCRKIIVDSSKTSYQFDKNYSDVEYYHEAGISYYDNIYKGLKLVKTKYVLQLPDDDFALKQGIVECLKFLLKEGDLYVGADGERIKFSEETGTIKKDKKIGKPELRLRLRLADDFLSHAPLDRVKYFLKHYVSHLPINHVVLKTDVLKQVFEISLQHPFLKPVHYHERVMSYIVAINGNVKTLPIVYLLKSTNESSIQWADFPADLERDKQFYTIVERLKSNCDPLSQLLSEATGMSLGEAHNFTLKLFADHWQSMGRPVEIPPEFYRIPLPSDRPEFQEQIQQVLRVVKENISEEPIIISLKQKKTEAQQSLIQLHLNLFSEYRRSGQITQASDELQQLEDMFGKQSEIQVAIGDRFWDIQDFEQALKHYYKALSQGVDINTSMKIISCIAKTGNIGLATQLIQQLEDAVGPDEGNKVYHFIEKLKKSYGLI